MKKKCTFLLLAGCLLALCLLFVGCGDELLYAETREGITYSLYGTENGVTRIQVSTPDGQTTTYAVRGLRGAAEEPAMGLRFADLNFDGRDDMMLLTARTVVGDSYACFLQGETPGDYVLHEKLSSLRGLQINDASFLSAYEHDLMIDPATDDTPAFQIETYAAVNYIWQDDALTAVSRAELTYYQENEVYSYITYLPDEERPGRDAWVTATEQWIFEENFDADRWPLGHFFVPSSQNR